MFIVEGPDGAGKTTLIKNLGGEVFAHLKSLRGGTGEGVGGGWANPGEDTLNAYTRQIMAAKRSTNAHRAAFDRFHISERIYGPMLRGKQDMSHFDLSQVCKMLLTYNVPIIMCLPSLVTCMANVRQEGRERPSYQTDQFLWEAYHRYWEVLAEVEKMQKEWGVPLITHYDYKRHALPVLP